MKVASSVQLEAGRFPSLWEAPTEYANAIRQADTADELRGTLREWFPLAWDGSEQAQGMDAVDYLDFQEGLKDRRKQTEKYSDRFGAILVPETMLRVTMVAEHFKVPWALAFNRLRDVGRIVVEDGKYIWSEPEEE